LDAHYDWILCFDVIEHVESPRELIEQFTGLLKPNGKVCLFTPRAEGINLIEPELSIHQLHTPCHLHLLSEYILLELCTQAGFLVEGIYHRWYQDSWLPCASRRFIELFMKSHGNDMDAAFDRPNARIILRTPLLWFYAIFGYYLPSRKEDTMMTIFKVASERSSPLS